MALLLIPSRKVMRGERAQEKQKFLRSRKYRNTRSKSYGCAQLISNCISKKLLDSGYMVYCRARGASLYKKIFLELLAAEVLV